MSRTARIGLIALGIVVVFVGIVAWSIEDTYGHGLDFSTRPADGQVAVYEASAGEEPVFSGSPEEAFEYMDERRATGKSFVVPALIIAAGAILVIVGAIAGRWAERAETTTPSDL